MIMSTKTIVSSRFFVISLFCLSLCLAVGATSSSPQHSNSVSHSPSTGANDHDPFIPTNEWQPIQEGQSIPAGLHVRMDLTTGQQHAKLLDPDEPTSNEISAFSADEQTYLTGKNQVSMFSADDEAYLTGKNPEGAREGSSQILLREELEKTLKNINEKLDAENESEDKERVRKQFRSMDELKKEFAEMNLAIRTDREILKDLVGKLADMQSGIEDVKNEAVLTVLRDLEYMVHQVDNARDFVEMKGLTYLKPLLQSGSYDPLICAEAAHILGSASQSNGQVQIAVLENGFLEMLLKEIGKLSPPSDAAVPSVSETVMSRLVFALTALVRHFPLAQKRFVDNGGVPALVQVMRQRDAMPKLPRKIMAFINDLLAERNNARLPDQANVTSDHQRERLRQYSEIPLEDELVRYGWCETLVDSFGSPDKDFDPAEAHYALQYHGIICRPVFMASTKNIESLCAYYRDRALRDEEEGTDDYFTYFADSCDDVVRSLPSGIRKEEL